MVMILKEAWITFYWCGLNVISAWTGNYITKVWGEITYLFPVTLLKFVNGYFSSKVNICNVNCARATAFIFGTRTGVLVKVSKFWDTKCPTRERLESPNLRIHAECSNLYWAIRARHLLSHVFEYRPWRCRYFWSKVSICNVNCARATAWFSTHERVFLWKCHSFWDKNCHTGYFITYPCCD